MSRVRVTSAAWCLLPWVVLSSCGKRGATPEVEDPPQVVSALAGEASPYLQRHADHPVAWQPWGDAAFEQARREHKPVLLSIGFASCHWCHVMERESFRDSEVADFLNRHFICIKMDREERPDVDRIYQAYIETATGSGGWPATLFLTPERKPFFGGNYFPRDARDGLPGFLDLIRRIAGQWAERSEQIALAADGVFAQLGDQLTRDAAPGDEVSELLLERAVGQLRRHHDARHGGFGGAPKFPWPTRLRFLLEYGRANEESEVVALVEHSVGRMAAGAIHDQVGGGFFRYTEDGAWKQPHFEKMLYDNALLLGLCLDLHAVGGGEGYDDVARGIADFVLRELRHPEGGFFSSLDAEVGGEPGAFYRWDTGTLEGILSDEERALVARHFGLDGDGQLPRVVAPLSGPAEVAMRESAKRRMLEWRGQREAPVVDRKVLASWNGLMLGALARASVVLDDERYLEAAMANRDFIRRHLWDAGCATLHHRWIDGDRDDVQLLESYAGVLAGMIELYPVTRDPEDLAFAGAVADAMLVRFEDSDGGGFWQRAREADEALMKLKHRRDGAVPSGNGMATLGLLRLAALNGGDRHLRAAERSLQSARRAMAEAPEASASLLEAWMVLQAR